MDSQPSKNGDFSFMKFPVSNEQGGKLNKKTTNVFLWPHTYIERHMYEYIHVYEPLYL